MPLCVSLGADQKAESGDGAPQRKQKQEGTYGAQRRLKEEATEMEMSFCPFADPPEGTRNLEWPG